MDLSVGRAAAAVLRIAELDARKRLFILEGTAAALHRRAVVRQLGLQGVRCHKAVRITLPDPKVPCPPGRVNRPCRTERPNQLWVSDFIYASILQGWVLGLPTADCCPRHRSLRRGLQAPADAVVRLLW